MRATKGYKIYGTVQYRLWSKKSHITCKLVIQHSSNFEKNIEISEFKIKYREQIK